MKHQLDSKEVAAPSPKLGTADGLLLHSHVFSSRVAAATSAVTTRSVVTTRWGRTTITRWLVVTLVVLGRLLLRSLQVNGTLVRLFSLEQGSLTSTACHEFELSFINKVLKVHTRVELDVHRLDVLLGEFGVFSITINCEGAESLEKFTEENIKSVNIKFNPGVDFENLVGQAEFKLVASRAGQAALLKAEKANETTVDLEAAKKKPTKDDKSDNKPSGDGGDTPNPGGGSSSTGSSTDGGDVGIE